MVKCSVMKIGCLAAKLAFVLNLKAFNSVLIDLQLFIPDSGLLFILGPIFFCKQNLIHAFILGDLAYEVIKNNVGSGNKNCNAFHN